MFASDANDHRSYTELFWDTVIGPQYDAEGAVQAFDLVPDTLRGFEEWVGTCQAEAERQGAVWPEDMDVGYCLSHAARALKEAADAIADEQPPR